MSRTAMSRTARRTAGLALAGVVVALVGVLLAPRALGLTPYVVTSGSMRPAFGAGAVVLVRDVPATSLAVGDVITFRTSDGTTTHRITGQQPDAAGRPSFTTRGDANPAADLDPVDPRNVLGQVRAAVPLVGHLLAAVRTPAGLLVLLVLLGVTLLPARDPARDPSRPSARSDTRTPATEEVAS